MVSGPGAQRLRSALPAQLSAGRLDVRAVRGVGLDAVAALDDRRGPVLDRARQRGPQPSLHGVGPVQLDPPEAGAGIPVEEVGERLRVGHRIVDRVPQDDVELDVRPDREDRKDFSRLGEGVRHDRTAHARNGRVQGILELHRDAAVLQVGKQPLDQPRRGAAGADGVSVATAIGAHDLRDLYRVLGRLALAHRAEKDDDVAVVPAQGLLDQPGHLPRAQVPADVAPAARAEGAADRAADLGRVADDRLVGTLDARHLGQDPVAHGDEILGRDA